MHGDNNYDNEQNISVGFRRNNRFRGVVWFYSHLVMSNNWGRPAIRLLLVRVLPVIRLKSSAHVSVIISV